jgi:uncharacterized protein (TIRG00374 family)
MMVWLHRPILTKLINLIGWSRLEELVRSIDVTLSATENVKKQMALYILLTIGAWTTQALRTVIVAKAFGYDVPIHVLLFVLPLMSVLSIIPITISGLGLIEGGVTAMLVELGVPGATGFAVALADRFITVLVHILIGARYSTKIM